MKAKLTGLQSDLMSDTTVKTQKLKILMVKKTLTVKLNPVLEKDDDVLHFEYIKDNPSVDLRNKIKEFKPDLLAVTCTENNFPTRFKINKRY